ncbi:putative zinc-binding metallopeptidase [uncultured Maritimibacter sp.]|jgi:hypothetical protein|uniref:zinc-binding metallopeptidase family protein n=1 Tax=uncultured Maritimibacter sp. TaxID=991866 RepID=UPI000AC2F0AF|nr:putative zinc-binding metallopeptidase [uncultured Maritimibacter sp.]
MRRYDCPTCGSEIFFHNTDCLACGTELVFSPGQGFSALSGNPCANRDVIQCNWVAHDDDGHCRSCRHTTVIPDLAVEGNSEKWARIEAEKRLLVRMLASLGLPLDDDAGGPMPRFEFKADDGPERVLTGHAGGIITLNIEEADDAAREAMRAAMGEPYRTLAGHLRHEIAHWYEDRLTTAHPERLDALRAVFGDDRADYGAALAAHYANGPREGWEESYVSAYAASHPWEDFAETWAHVFHILAGLEVARAFALGGAGRPTALADMVREPMVDLVAEWVTLSIALNAANAAMGHETFYPFVLTPQVTEKLDAVRALIVESTAGG